MPAMSTAPSLFLRKIMLINTYALDFEAEYSKELSVRIQGAVNYSSATYIFLVAIYGPDVEYVGPVEEAPWERISGHHWVSHNAGFDQAVFRSAVGKGQISGSVAPVEWDCTADLSSYFGIGRSLKEATKVMYGISLSKDDRAGAKGKRWPVDFTLVERESMKRYALDDARHCWNLWRDLGDSWPEKEKLLSRLTRKRCLEGVVVDTAGILKDQLTLEAVMREAKDGIPWSSDGVILSLNRVKTYCEDRGIPAPVCLAEDSEECARWQKLYGAQHPVVGNIRRYRKANTVYKKLGAMRKRTMPNGRLNFGLKYFGTHTGRWSGAEGVNLQNLPREPVYDVDLRAKFVAPDGKKLVICDLAQIEPRVTACVCSDTAALKAMQAGYGVYEAFALSTGVWSGEKGTFKATNKDLYALCKAQVLALGYGCGPEKFIYMAKQYADLEITEEQAKAIVADFRNRSPKITSFWNLLERRMEECANRGRNFVIELPSRRRLRYTAVGKFNDTLLARLGYTGRRESFWGGKLMENVIQATARDILAEAILRLEAAGIPVIFSAHDEVICEVEEDFNGAEVRRLMTIAPDWMQDLPLEAEYVESKYYLK
jgi:DNA polymerase I-like protein with 3'-5' exonuclease and polymerase domains